MILIGITSIAMVILLLSVRHETLKRFTRRLEEISEGLGCNNDRDVCSGDLGHVPACPGCLIIHHMALAPETLCPVGFYAQLIPKDTGRGAHTRLGLEVRSVLLDRAISGEFTFTPAALTSEGAGKITDGDRGSQAVRGNSCKLSTPDI